MGEEEPLFNFTRWRVPGAERRIACASLCAAYLAVATNGGEVFLLDNAAFSSSSASTSTKNDGHGGSSLAAAASDGGAVQGAEAPQQALRLLRKVPSRIHDVKADVTGEYLTTAGDDGNVAVFHVASMEEAFVYPHHRATLSTDMPPDFVRQQSKPVFTGGANGKLYLVRRNWLTGKSQETLLSEGDGPVTAIASNGTYVAWATAAHVRVWDLEREEPVCAVDAPPAAISASMTPARLCWEADSTLVVAWGLSLRVLRLQRSTQNDAIGVASAKAASRGTAAPTGDQAGTPAYAGTPHGDDAAEGKDAAPSGAEGANELGARVASGSLPAPQAHTTSSHNAVGQSPHASSTSSTNTGPASATMLLTMELDAVVVGAVPFGEHLAILCLSEYDVGVSNRSESEAALRTDVSVHAADAGTWECELRIIEREAGRTLSRDILPLTEEAMSADPASFRLLGDVQLAAAEEALPQLLVIAPQSIICASARSAADHLEWELQRGRLDAAVAIATAAQDGSIPASRRKELVSRYASGLVETGKLDLAVQFCAKFLHDSPTECERLFRAAHTKYGGSDRFHPFFVAALAAFHLLPPAWAAQVPAFPVASRLVGTLMLDHMIQVDVGSAAAALARLVGGAHNVTTLHQSRHEGAPDSIVTVPTALAPADSHFEGKVLLAGLAKSLSAEKIALQDAAARASSTVVAVHELSATPAYRVACLLACIWYAQAGWQDAIDRVRWFMAETSALQKVGALTDCQRVGPFRKCVASLFLVMGTAGLVHLLVDDMRLFVDLDARATSDLIVSHPDALPLTTIVEHLRVDSPRVLLQVLDAFFTAHTSKFNALAEPAVHDQLLQLYLRFDEEKVLTFLKRSTRYTVSSAQAALAFASSVAGASATLKRALVHVLVRLNQHSRAVSILVDELHDTASAIDVAVALDDADVWVDVLTRCAKSSDGEVVGSIFDRVGTTPQFERRLISMLPPSLHIPRLAQRLQLVIRDKHLLLRMTQTCAELCKQDTTTLFSSFVSAATSGMAMPRSTACTFCSGPLCEPARTSGGALPGSEGSAGAARDAAAGVGVGNLANLAPFEDGADVVAAASGAASSACVSAHDAVVFFCRHAYHATCIQMYAANLQAARLALRRSRPRSDSSASSDWSRRRSGSVTGAASRRRLGGSGSGTPRSASTRRLRRASYGSSSVASDSGSSWNAEDTAADRPHALRCPMCSASDAA